MRFNSSLRNIAIPLGVAALAVSACGTETSEGSGTDDTLLDAEELNEQGVSALSLAFDQVGEGRAFSADLAVGMQMDLGALGQTMEFDADLSTPMAHTESDTDGEQYTVIDLAPLMDATVASMGEAGSTDASEMLDGDLSMEQWQSGSTLIVDSGGFGQLLSQNIGVENPFPDDVFTVDLDQLSEAVGSEDVATAMSGQIAPDPVEMAQVLRDALGESAVDDGSGQRFSGTIDFSDYSSAFGQDPSDMLGGMDDPLEQMGLDAGEFLSIFLDVDADVEVTLDDGAVDTVRFDVDLTPMFAATQDMLGEQAGGIGGLFTDATFDMTMLMDYDFDESIDVALPEGDFLDATDEFIDVFGDLGAS